MQYSSRNTGAWRLIIGTLLTLGGAMVFALHADPMAALAAKSHIPFPENLLPAPPPAFLPDLAQQDSGFATTGDGEPDVPLEQIASAVSETASRITGLPTMLWLNQDGDAASVGEAKTLLPLYDGERMILFTQLGTLAISENDKERWIGNFGIGQRWFPEKQQARDKFLGYNVFLDHGFNRGNSRGGLGTEIRHPLVSLASNYYFPLSAWQRSQAEESRKERALGGWDAQVKGTLPFLQFLTLTGSYAQWDKATEDGPVQAAWSYGLELAPSSTVSGFITRRSLDEDTKEVMFGLKISWDFPLPPEKKRSPSSPALSPREKIPPGNESSSGQGYHFIERNNTLELEYTRRER